MELVYTLLRGKPNSLKRGLVAGMLCVVGDDYTLLSRTRPVVECASHIETEKGMVGKAEEEAAFSREYVYHEGGTAQRTSPRGGREGAAVPTWLFLTFCTEHSTLL